MEQILSSGLQRKVSVCMEILYATSHDKRIVVTKQPVGVVVCITPEFS